MNILERFNTWYDGIKEPNRFLFALFVIGVPFNLVLAFPFPTWVRIIVVAPILTILLYRIWKTHEK